VSLEEDPVATRWLGQPIDLFPQGKQLAAGFAQGVDELGVALGELTHPFGRLCQPLFQQPRMARRLGQLPA
jgi:hypothetical protein